MNRKLMLAFVALLPSVCLANPPATQPRHGYFRTFDLRPVAPPVPALKYQLAIDPVDRRSGNAAILYLQAVLLMDEDTNNKIDHALDTHWLAKKSLVNDPAVLDLLNSKKPLFELLTLASCREDCDWSAPIHEFGGDVMLPWLNHARSLAELLRVQFYEEIDAGKIDDAIATLRSEFALGRNVAKGMPLLGALVGTGITSMASDMTAELSTQPTSPNLYWALINLPAPSINLREAMDCQLQMTAASMPILAKATSGKITGDDWPEFVKEWTRCIEHTTPRTDAKAVESSFGLASLPNANKYYAMTRHMSSEEASKIDSRLVLCTYYLEQYELASDEASKIVGLPLPEMIRRSEALADRFNELAIADNNPFVIFRPLMRDEVLTFGRVERLTAATTAVEAIRSYAADHNGQLPSKLEDVIETPVPVNPMTGKMFDYRVEGDTATLSDETSPGSNPENPVRGYALVYTLRVLKQ